jgi:Domain of unknown function (DUF4386)
MSTHVPKLDLLHQEQPARRLAGALLVATGLMSLAPFPILGPAIGWPGSLDNPAAEQLAAIVRTPGAVAGGYGVYLVYSVMVLPALGLAAHRLLQGYSRLLVQLVVAFAALSVLARATGILRWLTVMPALATAHAAADATTQAALEQHFRVLNSYGGGVGELLGVALFMGLAMGLLVGGAIAAASVPRWLSALGLVATAALLGVFLPAVGVAVELPIAVAVTALSVWMWALGGWLWLRPRPGW